MKVRIPTTEYVEYNKIIYFLKGKTENNGFRKFYFYGITRENVIELISDKVEIFYFTEKLGKVGIDYSYDKKYFRLLPFQGRKFLVRGDNFGDMQVTIESTFKS